MLILGTKITIKPLKKLLVQAKRFLVQSEK